MEMMAGSPASLSGQDVGFVSLSSSSRPCSSSCSVCGKPGLAGNLWVTIGGAAAGLRAPLPGASARLPPTAGERGGPGRGARLLAAAARRAPGSARLPAFFLTAGSGLRTPPKSWAHPASCPLFGPFSGLCFNLCCLSSDPMLLLFYSS